MEPEVYGSVSRLCQFVNYILYSIIEWEILQNN